MIMLLAIARCSGISDTVTDYALVCLRKRGIKDCRLHSLAGQIYAAKYMYGVSLCGISQRHIF